MIIKCHGSRGSFPVSGEQFARYGGDTTCVEIVSDAGDVVFVDAGTGLRAVGRRMAGVMKNPLHIIFTHYHLDHIIGFPGFLPLYNKNAELRVYGAPYVPCDIPNANSAATDVQSVLRNLMRAPYFPVDLGNVPAKISFHNVDTKPFAAGSLAVTPIRLNHPNGGNGYRFDENGKSFVFLTDNELRYGCDDFDASYFEKHCANADLLMHDSEYTDEEYPRHESWGHSKYTDAIKLALAANVKKLALFHIGSNRTDAAMDAIVEDAKTYIAKNNSSLECVGVGAGDEIVI